MPNITQENYPTEDGWNHIQLDLKPGEEMTEERVAEFMAFCFDGFQAELKNFETHVGPQEGLTIRGVIRRIQREEAP